MKINYTKGEGTRPEFVSVTLIRNDVEITAIGYVYQLYTFNHLYDSKRGQRVYLSDKEALEILALVREERDKVIHISGDKSMASWRESGLNYFETYFIPGDTVTADVVDHYINIYPPLAMRSEYVQAGEPYNRERNPDTGALQSTYITFYRYQGMWWFAGYCFANEKTNRVMDYDRLARRIDELEASVKNRSTLNEYLTDMRQPCKKAVLFDLFYLTCPYFDGNVEVNNGYGCNHPLQEETEFDESTKKEQGKCYCWSCPLGFNADKESVTDPDVDWSDINNNRDNIEIEGNEHEYLIVNCGENATEDEKKAYASYTRLAY